MRTPFVFASTLTAALTLGACASGGAEPHGAAAPDTGLDSLSPDPDEDGGDAPAAPVPRLRFQTIDYDEPFDRPTSLGFVPGTKAELLVLEQHGRVLHLELAGDALRLLGSFRVPDLYTEVDCGLIALTFDPDFEHNRYLYVSLCLSLHESGIFRFTFDAGDYSAIPDSMREILVRGDEDAKQAIHNAGTLGFDAQGRMWALFGDKGVGANAHDLESDLGKVLRIVPSRDADAGGYQPAGDLWDENPALIARGFRSPWRGAMDTRGRLFVGDVGDEDAEELDLVKPGGDHGWPTYEGPCRKDCGTRVNPIASWRSEDDDPYVLDDEDAVPTTRRVSWLGRFLRPGGTDRYRGQLDDRLLFGDMCSGFVRVIQVDARARVILNAPVGHRPHLTGVDQAPDGYLYALTYGGCAYDRGTHPGGALRRIVLDE